jgi:uncharacterized RDD family membrane protein YckC
VFALLLKKTRCEHEGVKGAKEGEEYGSKVRIRRASDVAIRRWTSSNLNMRRVLLPVLLLSMLLVGARVRAAGLNASPVAAVSYESILAHAGDQRLWVARVGTSADAGPAHGVHTDILIRGIDQKPGNQDWHAFASVPARVTAMASRGSELAVLLEDGSWMRLWSADGAASGLALPAGGQMRTLASDGVSLWAIGSVRGGLYAAQQAVAADIAATAAATATADTDSATRPTAPAAASPAEPVPEAEPNHAGSLPSKLVLFHEHEGSWTPVADLPADAFVPTAAPLALAIVGQEPLISFQSSTGSVRTLGFGDDFRWHDLGVVHAPDGSRRITHFSLMVLGDRPLLWVAEGRNPASPGAAAPGVGDARWLGWLAQPAAGVARAAPALLAWDAADLPQAPLATAIAGNQLAAFALHDDKIYEREFVVDGVGGGSAPAFGSPLSAVSQIAIPTEGQGSPLQYGIDGALLVALAFSVLATVYRRRAMLARRTAGAGGGGGGGGGDVDGSEPVVVSPPPAPLVPRLLAGLIDLLPVLACSAVLTVRRDASLDPLQQLSSDATLTAVCLAAAVYLLHTTLSELLAGRTVGKWALGLRPVTLSGQRPAPGQMLLRNVLRIIDLLWFPLVLVVLSPLRQRSADVAAGTMVVRERDVAKAANGLATNDAAKAE